MSTRQQRGGRWALGASVQREPSRSDCRLTPRRQEGARCAYADIFKFNELHFHKENSLFGDEVIAHLGDSRPH